MGPRKCPSMVRNHYYTHSVLRLLTALKMSHEAAKKRAEPYTKIVEELPGMRRETVELVRKAVTENRRAYVLVNNRSEGNAPLTISRSSIENWSSCAVKPGAAPGVIRMRSIDLFTLPRRTRVSKPL